MSHSKDPIRVSDHAVLRYLERAMGLNIEMVREHILSICVAPASFGAVCVRAEGLRFEIASGTITTVVPDRQQPGEISRAKTQHKIARERA
jgi:hypothetical protein